MSWTSWRARVGGASFCLCVIIITTQSKTTWGWHSWSQVSHQNLWESWYLQTCFLLMGHINSPAPCLLLDPVLLLSVSIYHIFSDKRTPGPLLLFRHFQFTWDSAQPGWGVDWAVPLSRACCSSGGSPCPLRASSSDTDWMGGASAAGSPGAAGSSSSTPTLTLPLPYRKPNWAWNSCRLQFQSYMETH